MKSQVAFFVWGAMSTGAQASSFVVLDPTSEPSGPSMIVLGSAALADGTPKGAGVAGEKPVDARVPLSYPFPGEGAVNVFGKAVVAAQPSMETKPDSFASQVSIPRFLSPSIIAYGDVQLLVSYEQLASIGASPERKTRGRPEQMPMVIRGGLVGDASTLAVPTAPATPVRVEAKAPEAAGGLPQPKDAPQKRETPPAAPPPPEPPTRKPK